MANKKKKKTKSAFEVLDQRRNEQIAQMSKGSTSTYKKLNKMLAPSSKEQISTGGIKTNDQTSIDYANNNTRDVSRQIIAPTSSLTSNTSNPVELVQNMQAQQENERQKRKVEQLKKKVEQEKQEKGILTPTEMQDIAVSENFGSKKNYLPSGVEKEKTQLDKQREKVTGHEIKKAIAPISEVAKKNAKLNDEYQKTSNTYKQYTEAVNKQRKTESLANQEKVDNEETTLLDKINPFNAILSGLEKGLSPRSYKDENGNVVSLPSYTQLKTQKVKKDSGIIGKAYQGAMESIGAMIPSFLTSAIPVAGTVLGPATTWATSFNSAQNDKLLEGYSQEEAEKYAIINATLETGLGKAMGGITKTLGGKSSPLSKNIKKLTDKVFKNKGASYFASHAVSELAEEETQTFLDPINEHLTLGKYDSIGEALNSVELEDVGLTALSTLMTMGLTEGKTSYDISKLERNINKVNKKYGTDFKLKDNKLYRENLVSEKEYNNRIQELEAKGTKLTKEEKNKIKKETQEDLQNGNISIDTIESVFAENEYNKYKQEETKLNNLKKQIQELDSKKISELTVKEYDELKAKKTTLEDQIKSLENSTSKQELQAKMSDVLRSDDSAIQKSYEKELKVKSFKDSAKQYWNESEDSKSAIDTIEKVIRDKNYNIMLDPTIKTKTGKEVAGRITTNENGEVDIRLNPNSNRTLEFLLTHEITHAIETDKMKNLVMDYAKKNKEFDTALNELKKTYETEDVSDEVLADISGQLLGNQDFILNLSTKKPNIFKKMYDKIISIANKITGNSKENWFIKDLKNKWEEAYRTQNNHLNKKVSLSIQKDENGNKYVNVDTNQDIFKDKRLTEQVKIAKQYILDNFRQNGINVNNENINVTSKTANEYTHPKKQLPATTKSSKLKAATELDNLLSISEYQSSNADDGRHPFAKDGWDYYKTVFKVGDNVFTGLINIGKSGNKKTLYDITKIKRIDQNRSTSANAFTTSLVNSTKDNISQSDTKVKSNTSSTKYSMQESKNDTQGQYAKVSKTKYSKETQTWQGHLEKNYKATGKHTNMADLRKNNSPNANTSNNTNKVIAPIRKDMKPYLEMGEIIKKENDPNYVPKIPIAEPELKKNKIAPIVKKESKLGQLKEKAAETIHTGQYLLTNKNEAIDRFSDKVGNKNIKILADHVNNVQGEISTNINNAQIDNNGKKIGKSIVDIFEPARKEKLTEAFNDYLFNLSNISRHKQGKGSLIPLNESETLVKEYEKAYPQMKEWAKDVNNYNKNLLYKQAEAGLISKDTADYFNKKYSFYVPFIENIDTIRTNDTGKIMTKSTVKTARGGSSKNLLAFEEAMIRQTQSAITNMRKNQLYNEIIDSIPEKTIDFESNTNPNISGNNLTTDKQNYLLSSYKDGKMQQAKIDKDLYEGLEDRFGKSLKELEQKFSFVTKPLQKISNVRRNILTTWSPSFVITNPLKDIQDAPLNSKYGASWIKNYPKAMKELTTGKGEHLEEFLNMYGQGNLWGGENVDSGAFDVSNIAKTNKRTPSNNKAVKISKAMVKKTTQLNEIMEMGPRYAEYLASLEHGTSQMEALYNAREVTTNFGRGGVITKALNRNGFTFLNASVQGFSKLIRNFSGENGAKGVISASAKAVALGVVPALFNALWFDDDDDYNDLPDYIKDNYYLFKTDDNDFIRIPKGRMISIFGSAARRTLERTEGKRNEMTLKEDIKSYGKNAWSQVGVGDLKSNKLSAPIKQAFGTENGTAWYGGDIVPSRLQDKPAGDQYDSSIDKVSIWIGKKLGISPYKVNYVIDQYSGGIGDMILPVMTDEAQSDSNSIIGTALAPLRDKFTANSISDNKNVSNFYTKKIQLMKIANGSKATNKDKLVYKYMDSIGDDMGALYQEMREVQENNKLSKSEKFKKALIIKEEINKLAKEGMNGYSKVENVDNYGIVGDREFYKWTNDEGEDVWSAPKDKDLETLNSLGLTAKEKGSYYKTQSAMYDAWDKYDDYNVSKLHAIKSIIDSNLPDEAKYQLYNNSYSKDKINIAQTIGIDADTFLNYAKQDFKANKDKNGKSISGSKKRKVYNYLNKMNVNYEDRLILAKMQGYETEEGNAEIVNYLNNSNVTPDEFEAILKQLKFTIKNGYVRW